MEPLSLLSAIGGGALGLFAGLLAGGLLHSSADAETGAEYDRLRHRLHDAEQQARILTARLNTALENGIDLKRRLDEKSAELLKTCKSVVALEDELKKSRRLARELTGMVRDERKKYTKLFWRLKRFKKNFRRRRKTFAKRARGARRLSYRADVDRRRGRELEYKAADRVELNEKFF